MGNNKVPWREWRFELTALFREKGFTKKTIESMDWKCFKGDWSEGLGARDVFEDEIAAME